LKFLIDAMLPPRVADLLSTAGHDATTPARLGGHSLPDDALVDLAAAEGRVIVTENASDFASVTACPVLFVRTSWWPSASLAPELAAAVNRWASANSRPGPWPHWLGSELR
jgi:hypothetical protein